MKPSEKIEYEAARWVVRLERELTAAEQDRFLEWLAADGRHGEALTQHKAAWTRLNLLADWRPMHGARPNRDLLAPPRVRPARRRRRPLAWAIGLAAAGVVWAALQFGPAGSRRDDAAEPEPISTIEQRTLADGSTVALNRGAALVVDYSAHQRRALLSRGEAHFQVVADPARPFVVEVAGVSVRAVGTAFNVRLGPTAVQVLVTEGRVDVRADSPAATGIPEGSAPARVEVGQRCVVSLAEPRPLAVESLTRDAMERALAWQPRLLDFVETPLTTILAEFNRRNAPYEIAVRDPALGALPLSASLRSDNVEGFLRLLEGGFGIEAERSGHLVILHRERSRRILRP